VVAANKPERTLTMKNTTRFNHLTFASLMLLSAAVLLAG